MKRLISFVLVAALSFFSFIVYAEEPVSPSFLDFPSVLDSALDLLVVPLQFLLRFWRFDIFRMFWMVLFWIFILSLISRIVRMKG